MCPTGWRLAICYSSRQLRRGSGGGGGLPPFGLGMDGSPLSRGELTFLSPGARVTPTSHLGHRFWEHKTVPSGSPAPCSGSGRPPVDLDAGVAHGARVVGWDCARRRFCTVSLRSTPPLPAEQQFKLALSGCQGRPLPLPRQVRCQRFSSIQTPRPWRGVGGGWVGVPQAQTRCLPVRG